MIRPGWIPPASPYSLLQESLFPNEWLILVSCMMLNCTSRKQVQQVLPEFVKRWPSPQSLMAADLADVAAVTRPLGFANRRAAAIVKMTRRYLAGPWEHASELPGVGPYAAAAWDIFCAGTLPAEAPKDHALVLYYDWCVQLAQPKVGSCT